MWWVYFDRPVHDSFLTKRTRKAFVWGYGHYFVFASVVVVGCRARGGGRCGDPNGEDRSGWCRVCRSGSRGRPISDASRSCTIGRSIARRDGYGPIAAVLVLLTPFTGHAVPLTGAILAGLVGAEVVCYRNQPRSAAH